MYLHRLTLVSVHKFIYRCAMRIQIKDVIKSIQENAEVSLGRYGRIIEVLYADPILEDNGACHKIYMTLRRTGWFYGKGWVEGGEEGKWCYAFSMPEVNGMHFCPRYTDSGFDTMEEALSAGILRMAVLIWDLTIHKGDEQRESKRLQAVVKKEYKRLISAGIPKATERLNELV